MRYVIEKQKKIICIEKFKEDQWTTNNVGGTNRKRRNEGLIIPCYLILHIVIIVIYDSIIILEYSIPSKVQLIVCRNSQIKKSLRN